MLAEAQKPVAGLRIGCHRQSLQSLQKAGHPRSFRGMAYTNIRRGNCGETCRTSRNFSSLLRCRRRVWLHGTNGTERDLLETDSFGVSTSTKHTIKISRIASQLRLDLLASASSLGLSFSQLEWAQALDCAV